MNEPTLAQRVADACGFEFASDGQSLIDQLTRAGITLDAARQATVPVPLDELRAALERYGHHDETCASMYVPWFERPCNCGLLETIAHFDPPEQRYRDALASGLSDAEAREEGWPSAHEYAAPVKRTLE